MSQHGVPPEEIWPNDVLARDTQLHGYRITSILGRGGFGVTYLGEDLLGQVFAIKEYFPRQFAVRQGAQVHPASGDDAALFAECRERFVYEARALVSLGRARGATDDIVKVQTFFEANGTAYMVMEYVLGRSMQAVLRDHPRGMPEAELVPLLVNLLAGLATVHEAGLMHRDIKPGNILIRDDGRPVLIDFGSSREAGSVQTHGFTQIFSGGYAPPEQILGTRQGVFSDIYAVGVVGYEAIGGTVVDALARQQARASGLPDPMPPASEIGAGRYGISVLAALDAALALDPAARPVSAEAMAWRIEAPPEPVGGWPGDDTVVAPRPPTQQRPPATGPAPALAPPPARGRVALGAGAAAVVVVLTSAGWLFLMPPTPPPAPAPPAPVRPTAGLATGLPAVPAQPAPARSAEASASALSAAVSGTPAPSPPTPATLAPPVLPTPVADPAPLPAAPTPRAAPTPEAAVPAVAATPAPRAAEEPAPAPAAAETSSEPPTRLALAPPPASPPPTAPAEPPAAAPGPPPPATPTAPVPVQPFAADPPKPPTPPFGITEARSRAQELACALLGVGEAPGTRVQLWGAALPGMALDGLLDLLRREFGAVNSDIEPLEPGHCAAASTIAGMVRAAGERGPMRLTGPDAPVPAGSRFAAKGPRAPGRALYADLYGADGSVRHLLRQTEARGSGDVDIRFETTASGPPGRYLLVAVAATEPLEIGQHPMSEPASAYLPALQRALGRLPPGAPLVAVGMLSLVAPVPIVPPPARPAPATTPSRAPSLNAARCADIVARVQLGEALSDADRTALRTSCKP